MRRQWRRRWWVVFAIGLGTGCQTPPTALRHQQADEWEKRIAEVGRAVLERWGGRGWTIDDCQAIAREYALDLTRARLAEQVARARQWASFSTFLPQVEFQFQTVSMDKPPLRRLGEMTVAFQDQSVRQTSLRIVQPLFTPEAWLLHGAARRGVNVQRLARERATEWLDLAVVEHFGRCAVEDARLRAARQALEEAVATRREVESRRANGRSTAAELAAAEVAETARRLEVAKLERARRTALARLLETMGLPPTLEPELQYASLTRNPSALDHLAAQILDRPIEQWLYDALRRRLDLHIADENVEVRRLEILRSIALFLPRLYGFAEHFTTSDSYVVHDEYWASGLQGTLAMFAGVREIQAVRTARAEWREARTLRDLTAMAAMVQVIEARRSLEDVRQEWRVASQALAAARLAAADTESAYQNGRLPASARDHARASLADARARVEIAEVMFALAIHVFRDAVGLSGEDSE